MGCNAAVKASRVDKVSENNEDDEHLLRSLLYLIFGETEQSETESIILAKETARAQGILHKIVLVI